MSEFAIDADEWIRCNGGDGDEAYLNAIRLCVASEAVYDEVGAQGFAKLAVELMRRGYGKQKATPTEVRITDRPGFRWQP